MKPPVKAALISGTAAMFGMLLIMTIAYGPLPLVATLLQTGVPVTYYGNVMILLLSGAVGFGVSIIVLYLSSGPRYHRSRRGEYGKRYLGYGTVGFLTIGVPTLLMDPAALSVGLGVVAAWRILSSQFAEMQAQQAAAEQRSSEREVVPEVQTGGTQNGFPKED
jgi:hypothetical protein